MPLKKIEEFVRKRRLDAYVECSAKDDKESVKRVFEKATKLGLVQLGAITETPETPKTSNETPDCWSACVLT